MLDVAVVGGGPAGGRTAWLLAEAGYKIALYEEHPVIGEPCQCAGLVTPRVFEELGYQQPVLNRLGGARVHSPKGFSFSFFSSDPQPRGLVIDRPELDRSILSRAQTAGVTVHTEARVQACRWQNDHVAFQVKQNGTSHDQRARAVVGADGPASRVARDFGLHHNAEVLPAYGADISGWDPQDRSVDLFVGNSIAPRFFGWTVPTGDGQARLGLALTPGSGSARSFFQQLYAKPPTSQLFKDCKILNTLGGTLRLGLNPHAYGDGVVLVGDAAGLAKPTSGGGIYTGLVSARLAARTLAEALEGGLPTAKALASYQQRLNRTLGRELKRGSRLRRAFLSLSDEKLEQLFRLVADPGVLRIIEAQGDIDYASRVAAAVLKQKPQLLKFAPLLLKPFV